MIIFLYGRDSCRLKQNLDKIITEYRKKSTGISFSILDFGPDSQVSAKQQLEKLTDLIRTVSFFNEKRLIVLKNAFLAGDEVAGLVRSWKLEKDRQRILVFAENADKKELIKKDEKLFGLLSMKPNISRSFEPLEGKQLESWARKKIESLGGKIDSETLKKLVFRVAAPRAKSGSADSADIWRLDQEINKLLNYAEAAKNGDPEKNRPITTAEVNLLVGPEANLNIFEVVDAIASKSRYGAAVALHKHLERGIDPHFIFSMILYQFRNLLRVKSLTGGATPYPAIVKKTGLNPYAARKTYEQCKKFDLPELKRLFAELARIETDVKSGNVDMAESLYRFVIFSSA